MGCVSSKLLRKDIKKELLLGSGGDYIHIPNHVVSLTSSTLGVLNIDHNHHQLQQHQQIISKLNSNNNVGFDDEEKENKRQDLAQVGSAKQSPKGKPEVIDARELMGDLEDEVAQIPMSKKSPKEDRERSPFKCLNVSQVGSPKVVARKLGGKENGVNDSNVVCKNIGVDIYSTPKGVVKAWNNNVSSNSSNKIRKASSMDSPRRSNVGVLPSRRRSLSPLFDPALIDSIERELSQEGDHHHHEEIKKMVLVSPSWKSRTPKNSRFSRGLQCQNLEKFVEKCPPGGENCVVVYTTTLRGIRKTFEDCSVVRSIIESYDVRMIERDVSMDSGFKEELRKLMGTKEVRVPLVFVKGRLIGGADVVLKMDEEGKLGGLFEGIAKSMGCCEGCGGIRFVMCMECNGSCKVLDDNQDLMVRCGECNENGLIHCPICC